MVWERLHHGSITANGNTGSFTPKTNMRVILNIKNSGNIQPELTCGTGGSIDTTESQDPIVGFVFGHKGIIAGVSFEGTKFTKIWPDAEEDTEEEDIEEFNENALD